MSLDQEPDPLRRIPTKHAAHVHAEIGPLLRAARAKRAQSLETVAQQTRISKSYLDALENDRYEQFPAMVYLRGFLKSYCDYLEIDFDEIWARIDAKQPEPPTAQTPTDPAATAVKTTPPVADHAHHPIAGATGALTLTATLLAALLIFIFYSDHKAATPVETPPALQPLPRAIEPKLLMSVRQEAWLRLTIDGNVVYEGRVPAGATQEWKPNHMVALRTAMPSAVDLSLNGNPIALNAPDQTGDFKIEIP